MSTTGARADGTRTELRADLEQARTEFHALLDSMSEADWHARSRNPAWTNGQLMFHVAFGFILIPPLFWMIRFWSRRSARSSRAFAGLLNATTPLFNWVNALGPHVGAIIYGQGRLGRKFDGVMDATLRRVDSVADDEWQRGMYYPRRWDPTFGDFMTFEELFRYPIKHFRHHLRHVSAGTTANG